jgi:alanine-synthesizing transaminase
MMLVDSFPSIPVSKRNAGFDYAIRNIVSEAKKIEATGKTVHYLNIGDPVLFGFQTPPHLIEAVEKAMRDGQNGYTPADGVPKAREAVAREFHSRGLSVSADRVILTAGASEGIDLALSVLLDLDDEVLVSVPTYPLYTAVLAKLGARAVYYRTDPKNGWQPDIAHIETLITPRTKAIVVIDPNNPTGAVYARENRLALLNLADQHNLVLLSDEGYTDLAYEGRVPTLGSYNPSAPVISFSSLSKAYLAPGWRAGWMVFSGGARLDGVLAAVKEMADGRICSVGPMQLAVAAALDGDKSHQDTFLRELRIRAEITSQRLNAIKGISCVAPKAAFYAMPKVELLPGQTDQDYVLGLLRETGLLCVYGSGFGTVPTDGYFRVVFLASPEELGQYYDHIEDFTSRFLKC